MPENTSATPDLFIWRADTAAELLLAGDPAFEGLRELHAPSGIPAAIIRPRTPAEVAEALQLAHRDAVSVSVRSGGHGAKVFPNPGGVVIDMAAFDTVEVQDADTVRVGVGATWGAVAETLAPHGLVITSGDTSDVGVGGLALGGGMGWLLREVGLTIDTLVRAELVTVDGRELTASAEHEPELFWALRGGGGNFGVVTHLTFRATRLAAVVGGTITLALDDLGGLLRAWRDAMRAAPDAVTTTFLMLPAMGPGEEPTGQLLVCVATDDEEAGRAALAPMLALPGVRESDIARRPYGELLQPAMEPPPVTMVGGHGFVDLDDEVIDEFVAAATSFPAPTVASVRYLGGAFSRVPADATAFAVRDREAMLFRVVFLPPDADAASVAAVAPSWEPLARRITSTYGNFIEHAEPEHIPLIYPPATLARLRELKRSFDPHNVLARNHNVVP